MAFGFDIEIDGSATMAEEIAKDAIDDRVQYYYDRIAAGGKLRNAEQKELKKLIKAGGVAKASDGDLAGFVEHYVPRRKRCCLNCVDVSDVTNMRELFAGCKNFTGDVSGWDVSKVTDMGCMFMGCEKFTGDVSGWDVSKVTNMDSMFWGGWKFAGDISGWKVSSVTSMHGMFYRCEGFDGDISGWDVSKVRRLGNIFGGCPIAEAHKPKFKPRHLRAA